MTNHLLSIEQLSRLAAANAAFQTTMLGMMMECRVADGLTTKAEAVATLRRYAEYSGSAAAASPFMLVADYLESETWPPLKVIEGGRANA